MESKQRLSIKELAVVASMLFGLFFGAGNIIFPVSLGQMAGANLWPAILGFNITAVGLPLLAVVAMGLTRSEGLVEMTRKISPAYSYFFTVALYLTIGPFFATPRTATVAFEVGFPGIATSGQSGIYLFIYSLLFFAVVLYFSLKPSGILDWVGKFLNPTFLVLLAIILIRAFLEPTASIKEVAVQESYQGNAFAQGLLEGYNTMDGLAGLAFGIIVIRSIRRLKVTQPNSLARETVKSGVFSLGFMAFIYLCLAIVGAQSQGFTDVASNGGLALAEITQYYFGDLGQILLAAVMTVACLKTAIGLVVALAETFSDLFPNFLSERYWAIIATLVSFLVANIGLESIIAYSMPVLMLLYPLAITLILLHLLEPLIKSHQIYVMVTVFTFIAAIFDMIKVLPPALYQLVNGDFFGQLAEQLFPFYSYGFGWVVPAFIGLILGIILTRISPSTQNMT